MPRGGGSRRDLPECYGTRDGTCAGRGCLWERGCAAETWTRPPDGRFGARHGRRGDFGHTDPLRNGRVRP